MMMDDRSLRLRYYGAALEGMARAVGGNAPPLYTSRVRRLGWLRWSALVVDESGGYEVGVRATRRGAWRLAFRECRRLEAREDAPIKRAFRAAQAARVAWLADPRDEGKRAEYRATQDALAALVNEALGSGS